MRYDSTRIKPMEMRLQSLHKFCALLMYSKMPNMYTVWAFENNNISR